MSKTYLFVYGTLMRRVKHPAHSIIQQYCEFLADVSMLGKLYKIRHYPGAIESNHPTHRVHGELYQIHHSSPLFAALDYYEQCSNPFPTPHEFIRKMITVEDADQQKYQAWTYLYNHSVLNKKQIVDGIYIHD